jgi:hypothetical protein
MPADSFQFAARAAFVDSQGRLTVEAMRALSLLAAQTPSGSAPPTTGRWSQNDYYRNNAQTELGSVGQKYVIKGWICVAGGTPGTWVQDRASTGN